MTRQTIHTRGLVWWSRWATFVAGTAWARAAVLNLRSLRSPPSRTTASEVLSNLRRGLGDGPGSGVMRIGCGGLRWIPVSDELAEIWQRRTIPLRLLQEQRLFDEIRARRRRGIPTLCPIFWSSHANPNKSLQSAPGSALHAPHAPSHPPPPPVQTRSLSPLAATGASPRCAIHLR
jgi:hypothetical protein